MWNPMLLCMTVSPSQISAYPSAHCMCVARLHVQISSLAPTDCHVVGWCGPPSVGNTQWLHRRSPPQWHLADMLHRHTICAL